MRRGMAGGLFVATGGASAFLAACRGGEKEQAGGAQGPAQPGDDLGEVRFLTWELFDDPSFAEEFEEQFAPVNSTYFGSFDEMFGKLRAGGGGAYDAVMTASDVVLPLVESGDLAPFNLEQIPDYPNLMENFQFSEQHMKDGDLYAIPLDWGSEVIHVDTNELGQQPATLPFEMLFDPEFRGRVATMDDQIVVWATGIYLGYDQFWDMTDDQLADVQSFLVEKLTPNVRKFAVAFADMASLFANREVVIAMGWTGVIHAELLAVGADHVTDHNIAPTMPWYSDTMSLVADADNPEAVHAWANYNLQPEVSAKRFQAMGLPTTVPDAAQFLSEEEITLSSLDQLDYVRNLDPALEWRPIVRRDRYQEVWNSVKAGTA